MKTILIIGCGALSHELASLHQIEQWTHVRLRCLPASLHNRPEQIPEAVRMAIQLGRPDYDAIFVAYGDCGTGGRLDQVLLEEGVSRLPGAHCYAFYAGEDQFSAMAEAEPGTFYLTDFLVRHFQRLVMDELGIRQHPQLRDLYFGHYTRVLWLRQNDDVALRRQAEQAAVDLGLPLVEQVTGLGALGHSLIRFVDAQAPAVAVGGS
jgi:hypothetical protein